MQYATFIARIKAFFTKKKIIWTSIIVVLILGGWLIFGRKGVGDNIQTALVKRQDIEKTVLTTGQVVSQTDLGLSFQSSGVVRRINVKEGDTVYAGQILASLDSQSAMASLEQAKANYEKASQPATASDIAVSQSALDSTETTLENAKQDLFLELGTSYNNANVSLISSTNNLYSNPNSNSPQFGIPNTTQTNYQAVVNVNNNRLVINDMLPIWKKEVGTVTLTNMDQIASGSIVRLSTISNYLNDIINILSIYTEVSGSTGAATLAADLSAVVSAKSTIDALVTTITNDLQAIKSAESSLNQAKAALDLKQSPARPEDLSIALANVHLAEATLNNTLIVAPTRGTVTEVDVKLGELAQVSKVAIKLLNIGELHTEAQVSEADIASVMVGQSIDNTFDALGPDKHFQSKVLTVNPASTVVSGVVNYKVTGSLTDVPHAENISQIKPGMTANMTILVEKKSAVLTVPSGAIVNRDAKRFVKVIDDPKKKTYHEVEVQTLLEADGGLTEVISGLNEGQEVVTYIK